MKHKSIIYFIPYFLLFILHSISLVSFADPLCQGRFINPITDLNWNLIFPITIAGMRVGSESASP